MCEIYSKNQKQQQFITKIIMWNGRVKTTPRSFLVSKITWLLDTFSALTHVTSDSLFSYDDSSIANLVASVLILMILKKFNMLDDFYY